VLEVRVEVVGVLEQLVENVARLVRMLERLIEEVENLLDRCRRGVRQRQELVGEGAALWADDDRSGVATRPSSSSSGSPMTAAA
jgi:hypothetical protein